VYGNIVSTELHVCIRLLLYYLPFSTSLFYIVLDISNSRYIMPTYSNYKILVSIKNNLLFGFL